MNVSETASKRRFTFVVLLLLLATYVIWMLSLPAWPSQDGPVHLYYTTVLRALFSGAASPFQPYFFIKHLLPPYALYYYALLGLSHLVPLLVADRLVICAYLVLFVLGFRYLAQAIGPSADVTSLLASVLVLNWALGMGFANYCLSLALAFWAMGLWLRTPEQGGSWGKRIGFVVLTVLITLTHPVPLLIVLAFGGLDLLCRFLAGRRAGGTAPVPTAKLLTLCCSALCLLYVKAFTAAHPLQQRTVQPGSFGDHVVRRIKDLLVVKNVELLYGHWPVILVYRVCLGLILAVAITLTVLQWRRSRAAGVWSAGDSMAVFAACFLFGLPFLQSDMSGAYYFFERLNLLLWITMLLAASAWVPVRRTLLPTGQFTFTANLPRFRQVALATTVFTVAFTALLLTAANQTLRPFAERDYRLAHTELPLQGQLAMVLDAGPERKYFRAGPAWDPYYWDTVALLRRNGGLMVNAPWLDSPIIPLAEAQTFPGTRLPPSLANSPEKLDLSLCAAPALREDVLSRASVALFSPVPAGMGATAVPPLLGNGWSCQTSQQAGYTLCLHGDPETAQLQPQFGE